MLLHKNVRMNYYRSSSFNFRKAQKHFKNAICNVKDTKHSYVIRAQMHFAVLIVFAELSFEHRTSKYNLSITKYLLQKIC